MNVAFGAGRQRTTLGHFDQQLRLSAADTTAGGLQVDIGTSNAGPATDREDRDRAFQRRVLSGGQFH